MVGDADGAVGDVAFHNVDLAFDEVAIEDGCAFELKLEMLGHPHGLVHGHVLKPAPQVGAELFHFAVPNAFNGGGENFGVVGGHLIQRMVERKQGLGQTFLRDRQQGPGFEIFHQVMLGFVEERASGERVHLLKRGGAFAGLKVQDGVEEEAIGAGGVLLQRRGRVGLGGQAELFQMLQSFRFRFDQAVHGEPLGAPAAGAVAERADQMRVGADEVVGGPLCLIVGKLFDMAEHGEIELGIVDGVDGIAGRGPIEAGGSGFGCFAFEEFEVGELALDGPQKFQCIE